MRAQCIDRHGVEYFGHRWVPENRKLGGKFCHRCGEWMSFGYFRKSVLPPQWRRPHAAKQAKP